MELKKRKKCRYLDDMVCPMFGEDIYAENTPCKGCTLYDKIQSFKEMSRKIMKEQTRLG